MGGEGFVTPQESSGKSRGFDRRIAERIARAESGLEHRTDHAEGAESSLLKALVERWRLLDPDRRIEFLALLLQAHEPRVRD